MQILKIRYYQLKRDLAILFFPLLAIVVGLSFFVFNNEKEVGIYFSLLIIYLFYNFHKNRKDIAFIEKHFYKPKQQLIIEYQVFLLAFSVPCLFTKFWYCFFIVHTLILLIPFIKINTKHTFKLLFLAKWLKVDYIFISGIRRNFLSLLLLIIIALLLSPLKLFPLIALFMLNSLLYSFYEPNESFQILQSFNTSPKKFLNTIFYSGSIKILIINLPVLLINTLFNPDMVLFNVFFITYTLLTLITVISFKYSSYKYNSYSNNFQIKLILMSLGLFIPYLLPIVILFYYQARTEAITNLKKYLDDND